MFWCNNVTRFTKILLLMHKCSVSIPFHLIRSDDIHPNKVFFIGLDQLLSTCYIGWIDLSSVVGRKLFLYTYLLLSLGDWNQFTFVDAFHSFHSFCLSVSLESFVSRRQFLYFLKSNSKFSFLAHLRESLLFSCFCQFSITLVVYPFYFATVSVFSCIFSSSNKSQKRINLRDNLLGDGLLFVSVQCVAAWHPNAVRFTVLQQDHFFPDHKPGWNR